MVVASCIGDSRYTAARLLDSQIVTEIAKPDGCGARLLVALMCQGRIALRGRPASRFDEAVDEAAQIIGTAALSNQAPDSEYFEPMLRRVVENCDVVPASTTADFGYFSADSVAAAEAMGTEPFEVSRRQPAKALRDAH